MRLDEFQRGDVIMDIGLNDKTVFFNIGNEANFTIDINEISGRERESRRIDLKNKNSYNAHLNIEFQLISNLLQFYHQMMAHIVIFI